VPDPIRGAMTHRARWRATSRYGVFAPCAFIRDGLAPEVTSYMRRQKPA
jgi:hypothetical protein